MSVAVTAAADDLAGRAAAVARRHGLPLRPSPDPSVPFWLVLTPERLELIESGSKAGPVFVDFGARGLRRRLSGGGPREALVRAVGGVAQGGPPIADATAGLGQDAFVLASWGYRVDLFERVAPVAALLEDGIRRARGDGELRGAASRMTLHLGDASERLGRLPMRPDVVYLDPMYPERGKSARTSKAMQRLRGLLEGDPDASGLLEVALDTAVRRVVVKRPLRAPVLGGRPSGSIAGRTTRYDLYAPRRPAPA